MHILVTGGAGFIGSQIVDRYLELGHQVSVIDDLTSGRRLFVNPQAHFYQVDIRNSDAVTEVFAKEKPVVISHHAAQMDVRKSVADPAFDASVNILGLINLMEVGRQSGVKQVIFASSGGAVYGDTKLVPTPETSATQPASPYGISKLTSEYYLDFYQKTYGISYVSLRYGNVYGPRQNPDGEAGVVAIFTKKLLAGGQPQISGDGKQTRDFVFVGDVVNANVLSLGKTNSLTLNIGTGLQTSINEIYEILAGLVGSTSPKAYTAAKPGEQRVSCLDNRRAKELLGWAPQVDLKAGLTLSRDFFKHAS